MTTPAALALALAAWVAASSIVTAASFINATTSSNSASSPFIATFQVCARCLRGRRAQAPDLGMFVVVASIARQPSSMLPRIAGPVAGGLRQTKPPRHWQHVRPASAFLSRAGRASPPPTACPTKPNRQRRRAAVASDDGKIAPKGPAPVGFGEAAQADRRGVLFFTIAGRSSNPRRPSGGVINLPGEAIAVCRGSPEFCFAWDARAPSALAGFHARLFSGPSESPPILHAP